MGSGFSLHSVEYEQPVRIRTGKSASQLEWASQRLPSRTGHHARFSSNPVTVSSGMWPVAVVAADDDTRPPHHMCHKR